MTYQEALQAARGNMGPCKACPICNGLACGNTVPGPGAKGSGTGAHRNYEGWQNILLNMDTICENRPVDTSVELFGKKLSIPVMAAPIATVINHYGDKLDEKTYTDALVSGCQKAGIAPFLGDSMVDYVFPTVCDSMQQLGWSIPTIKPWNEELVMQRIDLAKAKGAKVLAMDIDGSGRPFLKNITPPSGSKTVQELRKIIEYAGVPFILNGIMTVRGAQKALEAGAAGIVVSNHGGRVLDYVPSTAAVLPTIADSVRGQMAVLVDGGIRSGIDVFKAIALGADAALIGRPFVTMVYGGGADGVCAYVAKLKAELSDAMEMCGPRTIDEISREHLFNA